MSDVRTYTSASKLPAWATDIVGAIRGGDLEQARDLFVEAAAKASVDDAVYAVAAVVEPGPDVITVGPGPLVFGNPTRDGWAWRCGVCLHTFRNGGRLPASGVNYKTPRGASDAAYRHANDDHAGSPAVKEMTR